MFKRIIVATDLSPSSDAVINCMNNFKSLGVEEVILFYSSYISHLDLQEGITNQSDETLLNKQKNKLEAQGFKPIIEITQSIPAEALKCVAKQKDVSLIIIGAQGQSSKSNAMLRLFSIGEVTSEIIQNHEKPLLIVRTKVVEKDGTRKIEGLCNSLKDRVLFATDFSDISMRAFMYVEKLVEDGCKRVTLLHVQDKIKIEKYLSESLQEFNRIDSERLERHKQQLLSKGAEEVEIKILYGIPTKEILDEARTGYSLIVMGSQGRGFFHDIFIGSVSHNVARSADVSLLLIPSVER